MNKKKRVTVTMDSATENFFDLVNQHLQNKEPDIIVTDSEIINHMLTVCIYKVFPGTVASTIVTIKQWQVAKSLPAQE